MATFWTDIGMCFESFQRLGSNEKKEARARAYRLLRLITVCTFALAILGIGAWAKVELAKQETGDSTIQTTAGPNSPAISGVRGNVTISSEKAKTAP
jgi:hypothetical protein